MKSNALKVVQLQEVEDLPELLAEALNDELFEKVKMERFPVLIKKIIGAHRGHCEGEDYTEGKEITICTELFDVRSERLRPNQIREIIDVYLHECAHRLTPSHRHNAAFLCLNMILHLRAGDRQILRVNVYDVHQEKYFGDAWKWAWELAGELYETDSTAEQCAEIVLQKYAEWVEFMDGADERAAALKSSKQAAISNRNQQSKLIKNQIKTLKQDRWLFAGVATIFTILTMSYFN